MFSLYCEKGSPFSAAMQSRRVNQIMSTVAFWNTPSERDLEALRGEYRTGPRGATHQITLNFSYVGRQLKQFCTSIQMVII